MIGTAPRRSFLDRAERFIARLLLGLPHPVQLRLSGGPQVVIDGQPLNPEMQLALSTRRRRRIPPLRAGSAELGRARMLAETRRYAREPIPLGAVRDLSIPAEGRTLAARHYAPDEPGGPHPLLVFFHGGGFILGDIETHDEPCRLLCRDAGVHVLSVAYRLAPEHPFPAAIEDGEVAFRWAVENAASLGADPSRIGVGGDSAGGNIAAVVSGLAANEPSPAFQLLIYPVADRSTSRPSFEYFADGFMLERADIEWFNLAYIGTHSELLHDVRLSPLLAEKPPAVPTVVVTGGFDPLRDEGEAYAAWLEEHGTPAELRRFSGLIHGFIHMTSVSPAAANAVREIAAMLRRTARAV